MKRSIIFGVESVARGLGRLEPRHILAYLVVAFLSWRIVAHGLSALLAPHDPRKALTFDAADPTTLMQLAQRELAQDDKARAKKARSIAARLLAVDPLAPGALSLYGKVAERLGDAERAERILRLAAAHLPIDLVAHVWLYTSALANGRLLEALDELDILLRARPSLARQLAPSLQATLGGGAAVEDRFFRQLAAAPPWRAAMLAELAPIIQNPNVLLRLFGSLKTSKAPPSDEEMGPLLARLLHDGRYDEAYAAWLAHLPQERLGKLGLLYNESFQYPVSNLPFDWTFTPTSGATIALTEESERKTLSVEFSGARVSFGHVRHMLMLAPGRYAFSGAAGTDDLDNELGLRWRIYCAANPSQTLATTRLLKKTTPLRVFRTEFTVPSEGCDAQWLKLEIPVRIVSDADVSGSAHYVNLAVESLASASSSSNAAGAIVHDRK
ncbi:hypothetical protein MSC49_02060 [Methylosinus sp. C49]|uniref:tetratricopeptide repeat protein n=1 Tax=Methylosinus sp. C49 TaxID=2699395 RepID=UPI00136722DD|nr:hypothetical protein [Methylosinus sp. C49]BBU60271.1 hypothetical protein MSC49_02060 [Methylosinus sp. C49]